MKYFLAPIVFFLLSVSSFAQQKVDSTQLITDLQFLSSDSLQGRFTGQAGHAIAQDYIVNRFSQMGLRAFFPEYKQAFKFESKITKTELEGVNLAAIVQGMSDEMIVITAHYDHMGMRNGQVFNGADDNASGVAALLAIAEYFQANTPYHTMVFVCFDAEEHGLKGADAFVNSIVFEKEKTLLNLNMDMVSRSAKKEIYASGTYYNKTLKKWMSDYRPALPVQVKLGHDNPKTGIHDWTNQSDQAAFHKQGIPFLYFGVEDHPDYHKPSDDFEKIDLGFYLNTTNTLLDIVKYLDDKLRKQDLK
ncbi:M28 family peptidase [Cytophagales bacterium LB-30]|uniref:M28 family peptidase n=1 Tax=Shiella aurantiaca TaxID=3058365 RepID=A0ABT8F5C2_9BACT|nr:M28 family peptidase [Shiella aurantiaca]MDN4165498.1 M28 family peptidase [Shiella aurantiaca]